MSTLKVTTVTSPDANTDLILASGNSQSGQILISANGAGVTLKANSTVNAITINTTSWTFSNNPVFSSNTLTIGTAAYFVANGNVGIGVSSPGAKLDILSSGSSEGVYFRNSNADRIQFITPNRTTTYSIFGMANGQPAIASIGNGPNLDLGIGSFGAGNLILGTNNIERMRIDGTGNIGIGTASPTMKLDVNGRIKTTGVYFGYDTSSAPNDLTKHVLLWSTNSSALNGYGFGITGNQLNYVSDQNHVWYNTDKEYMRITTDGQVGIGTPSPNINTNGRVLHIHNPSTDVQANSGVGIHITNGTTGATAARGLLIARWNDGVNYFGTYEAEIIRFGTNGFTTRLEIDSAGRVMMPYQPYMFAYSTGGDIAGAGVKLTSYTNVYRNVGNHYNSSTQRFTVPVTGNYYVMLQAWQGPGVSISGVALRVNGGEFTVHRMASSGTQTDYTTLRATGVYYLTAGDYIEPYTHSTNVNLHLSTGTTFSQFLVYLLS